MKKILLSMIILAGVVGLMNSCKEEAKYKALIVTGQNTAHDWTVSAPVLKQILESTCLFSIKTATTPEKGADMSSFTPDFSKFDLVVLDYDGDAWPEPTKTAFIEFVKNGGGVVVYHAANNPFLDWKEFNEITGLGGWGNRNENSGPYVYYKNDSLVRDNAPGRGGSHGPQHEYLVKTRNSEHPIMKGLPSSWMHIKDELYQELRGPAENMDILATAYADTTFKGTGRDEPVLFTVTYGKGRIFHTVLGHVGKNTKEYPAIECAGFITTLQRGAEWAASGQVTQEVPVEFPNSASIVEWPSYKPLSFSELMSKIEEYKIGRSRKYISDLKLRIRKDSGSDEKLLEYENAMLKSLKSKSCEIDAKKALIAELSWMGSDICIPVLEEFKNSEELKAEAVCALERLNK